MTLNTNIVGSVNWCRCLLYRMNVWSILVHSIILLKSNSKLYEHWRMRHVHRICTFVVFFFFTFFIKFAHWYTYVLKTFCLNLRTCASATNQYEKTFVTLICVVMIVCNFGNLVWASNRYNYPMQDPMTIETNMLSTTTNIHFKW